jgi:catechol 2,3-dioxygenase-like lactoylglutathione lyase family enzyme
VRVSITLLYGCFQIELVVRDLDAARAFMERVLGAAPVEQEFARDLRTLLPEGCGIDHVDCGGGTFQLNMAPTPAARGSQADEIGVEFDVRGNDLGVHARYLYEVGPCVTNLNFYVDDVVHAREMFSARGAQTLIEGPSTIVKTLAYYGPSNTRPDGDKRPFLFMGTRPLIGFDFEFMEPNFLHFADQSAQLPCFVGHRPGAGVEGLRLHRLTVGVPDLADTYKNLVDMFTPASRSNPYAIRQGSAAAAFRITLGGIELEYCQPLRADSALAEYLERCDRGVVWAEFGVPSLGSVLERVPADAPWRVTDDADLVGEDHSYRRCRIASREVVGFDVVLEEHNESAIEPY